MRQEREKAVRIPLDGEIKVPPSVDTGLSDILGLVVLLGPERGVAEVLDEEGNATVHCPLDRETSLRVPHLFLFQLLRLSVQRADGLLRG